MYIVSECVYVCDVPYRDTGTFQPPRCQPGVVVPARDRTRHDYNLHTTLRYCCPSNTLHRPAMGLIGYLSGVVLCEGIFMCFGSLIITTIFFYCDDINAMLNISYKHNYFIIIVAIFDDFDVK